MDEYYYAQSSRVKQEREYWTKLKQYAQEDNVVEFYKLYTQYLEWNNIYSPDRKAIYQMGKRVVELLDKQKDALGSCTTSCVTDNNKQEEIK